MKNDKSRAKLYEAAVLEALSEALSGRDEGVLKFVLTRGKGGRGYRQPDHPLPWLGISIHDRPDYPDTWYEEGIQARVCRTRLGQNPQVAGIKHLNRLEQVLARSEWEDEYQEGLMLDTENRVIEGVMSNLFLIAGETLVTPELNRCGVKGVMRDRILNWAVRSAVPYKIDAELSLEQVYSAEAVFVCNSVIGIWPVRRLENTDYDVHHSLFRQLRSEFNPPCA
jgi:4-amino-4-deoxychorismate lyase